MTQNVVHVNGTYSFIRQLKSLNLITNQEMNDMVCSSLFNNRGGNDIHAVDRTSPSRINYLPAPIPEIKIQENNLDVLLCERAVKLWNIGKPIKVLWSGGIDSTAALVALIKTNSEWYKSIEVITTNNEYPYFSDTFLKPHNCFVDLSTNKDLLIEKEYYTNDYIYVNGDLGDQLMGVTFALIPGGPELRFVSASTVYDGFIDYLWLKSSNVKELSDYYNLKTFKPIAMEWVDKFIKKCPIPIKNMHDFLWWCNFVLSWHEKKSFKMVGKTGDASLANKIHCFFDDEKLQVWSMTNHHLKLTDFSDWKTHKQLLKDFIYTYTNDNDYRINFIKKPSRIVNTLDHKIVYADSSGFIANTHAEITESVMRQSLNEFI